MRRMVFGFKSSAFVNRMKLSGLQIFSGKFYEADTPDNVSPHVDPLLNKLLKIKDCAFHFYAVLLQRSAKR